MSERYTIISADGHAGLSCEEYRPYLETRYHDRFDEYLAEREANRDEPLKFNYDYIMGWETENEEGLRGAYDPEQRDKELDADGVAADVLFPDADAITGMASPPFGAGLLAGAITDPELAFAGARAHNRFLAEMCSHHRSGEVASRSCPSPTTSLARVAEIEWLAEHPGIKGIMIPTMWHDHRPYNDPAYDPVWAACQAAGFPVHTHSGEAPRTSTATSWGSTSPRSSGGRRGRRGTCCSRAPSSAFRGLKFVVTEAAAYWASDMMWKWDQYMGGGHTTKKLAAMLDGDDLEAAVGLLRHEHLHRGLDDVQGGDPSALRDRL